VRQTMQRPQGLRPLGNSAAAWLAEIDEAQRVKDEALQPERTWLSESTVKATSLTFYVAIGALVLSIIAIGISVLNWLYP
jgi:hypothetical protein